MEGATSINTTLLVDINVESFPPYIYIYSNPLSKAYQSLMRLNFSTFHWIAHHQPLTDTGRASVHRPRISSLWSRLSIFKSSAWWFTVEDDNLPLLFQTVLSSYWDRCHIGVRVFLPTCPRRSQVGSDVGIGTNHRSPIHLLFGCQLMLFGIPIWYYKSWVPVVLPVLCYLLRDVRSTGYHATAMYLLRCICWSCHPSSSRMLQVILRKSKLTPFLAVCSLIFLLCSAPTL